MPVPTRLTLVGLLLVGSLAAAAIAGAGRVGLAAVCAMSGIGFGLNVWGLRDEFLDELQARRILTARRQFVTTLLCVTGFLLVVIAIVIFFSSQPGLHTH